jgi:hypothetical protein
VLSEATAINNSGQIAGDGTMDGVPSAFLLTPLPEPCGATAIILAACPLLLRRRRIQTAQR